MVDNEKQNRISRVCPKDCRQCSMGQQIYCATHLSFTSFEVMKELWDKLNVIESKINNLQCAENGFILPVTGDIEQNE